MRRIEARPESSDLSPGRFKRPKRIPKPNRLGLRLEDDLLTWLRQREDAKRHGVSVAIRQILIEKMHEERRRER